MVFNSIILTVTIFTLIIPVISADDILWPVEKGDVLNYEMDYKLNEETQIKGNILFNIESIGTDEFGFKNALTYSITTDFIVDINNVEDVFADHHDTTGAFNFLRFKFWGVYIIYNIEGLEEIRAYWQEYIQEQTEIGIELGNGFTGNASDTGYSYRTNTEAKEFRYTEDGILTLFDYRFSSETRSSLLRLALTEPTSISGYNPFWMVIIVSIGSVFILIKQRRRV